MANGAIVYGHKTCVHPRFAYESAHSPPHNLAFRASSWLLSLALLPLPYAWPRWRARPVNWAAAQQQATERPTSCLQDGARPRATGQFVCAHRVHAVCSAAQKSARGHLVATALFKRVMDCSTGKTGCPAVAAPTAEVGDSKSNASRCGQLTVSSLRCTADSPRTAPRVAVKKAKPPTQG